MDDRKMTAKGREDRCAVQARRLLHFVYTLTGKFNEGK